MAKIPIKQAITNINVTLCVSNGDILKEFAASLFELSKFSTKKIYNLSLYVCGNGETEQDAMKKIIDNNQDLILFIKPYVGFSVKSIDEIIKLSNSNGSPYGLCVPKEKYDLSLLKGKEITEDISLQSACCSFDINPEGGKINVDQYGRMKILAFQNHDIVVVTKNYILENNIDISGGISKMSGPNMYLCTNYTCSNNGTEGNLLERLKSLK